MDTEAPKRRRFLPANGKMRAVVIWAAITTVLGGIITVIVFLEKAAPYRPVFVKEMRAHAKADYAERAALETRTDGKIEACLDEIRTLREERNKELKRQNEMLRKALANMGSTS